MSGCVTVGIEGRRMKDRSRTRAGDQELDFGSFKRICGSVRRMMPNNERNIGHLEAALRIAETVGDEAGGFLIERARDQMRADTRPHRIIAAEPIAS